jgi:hypothetical protein
MKAIHNTNSEVRIQNFDLSKAGMNTIDNINSDNAFRLAGCFLGVWFSDSALGCYNFAHEYEIEEGNYMVFESLDELESFMYDEIQNIEEVTAYDLFRGTDKLIELVAQVRDRILSDGYEGIIINNDEEFDCKSIIALNLNTIK